MIANLFPLPQNVLPLTEYREVVLGAEIGRGNAATVHRGELVDRDPVARLQPNGGRYPVAVKVFSRIPPEDRSGALKRLAYVLGCSSHVDHDSVVGVFDYVMDAPTPFAVLELVEGQSVQQLLHAREREMRGPDIGAGLFIATRAAQGLAAALSARGTHGPLRMIHGELSPKSVLVTSSGDVKVTDFGLSMALGCESARVSIAELVARLRYLAPEVARGSAPDERADVFSLGVLLYELVCGPRISPNATAAQAMSVVQDGVVPVSLVEPQLPGQLRQLLRRAVDRDPSRRYPDAIAFAADLQRLASLLGVKEAPKPFRQEVMARALPPANDIVYQAEVVDWDAAPTIVDNK